MLEIDISKTLTAANGSMKLEVSLEIPRSSRVAVYGESGAGKTSLLRIISGLMKPDSGIIKFEGRTWTDIAEKKFESPRKRSVGYVFQDYALFPNMSVVKNLEFARKKGDRSDIVKRMVEIFELDKLSDQRPGKLSGGQQQRVALARSLIQNPDILLLDEPLSALDYQLRRRIQEYIKVAHRELGFTMFLVTHDQAEILHLADWLVWLKNGKVDTQGKPGDILATQNVSGKFRMTGEIIRIYHEEVIDIVEVLVGEDVIQVVVDRSRASTFNVGDKVMVASKAFNPIIQHLRS